MNLAMVVVSDEKGGKVSGGWLQDCTGKTLAEAEEVAHQTNAVNGNKLTIAIVDGPTPQGKHFFFEEQPLAVVRPVQPGFAGTPD